MVASFDRFIEQPTLVLSAHLEQSERTGDTVVNCRFLKAVVAFPAEEIFRGVCREVNTV